MTDDDNLSICDRCSSSLPTSLTQTGSPDTEYEGCTLCDQCMGENDAEGARDA